MYNTRKLIWRERNKTSYTPNEEILSSKPTYFRGADLNERPSNNHYSYFERFDRNKDHVIGLETSTADEDAINIPPSKKDTPGAYANESKNVLGRLLTSTKKTMSPVTNALYGNYDKSNTAKTTW